MPHFRFPVFVFPECNTLLALRDRARRGHHLFAHSQAGPLHASAVLQPFHNTELYAMLEGSAQLHSNFQALLRC